jgi:hypothetical protein
LKRKKLNLFIAILFGRFGLTVDSFGKIGNIIMHIIGIGCNLGAIFIVRNKKENQ